ncbi:DM13 domain-containing protein [Aphanothece stagnina]|uniref:DM13 domain-containing protein n=1 Tax=Aphanothece stagnina TaxID=1004305 RepID=UPI00398F838C
MPSVSRTGVLLTLLLASGGVGLAMATQDPQAPATALAPAPALASPPAMTVAMDKGVLYRGAFRQAEAPVQGSYTIRRDGQRTLLVLSDDFSTNPKAPDLKLAIGKAANPIAGSKPPAYALREGTYTVIAPLRAARGGQTYVLPKGIELADKGSVIIWCEQFNATMAWSPLAK